MGSRVLALYHCKDVRPCTFGANYPVTSKLPRSRLSELQHSRLNHLTDEYAWFQQICAVTKFYFKIDGAADNCYECVSYPGIPVARISYRG